MKTTKKLMLSIKGLTLASLIVASTVAAAQVNEIRILESGGPSGESIEKAYVTGFTKKTGIKVVRQSPTSLGKLQAMVQSKSITDILVELGSTNLILARATGLIEPLDWDKINPDPMFPEAKMPDGFGYQYFSTIMAWPKDTKPVKTWEDFWNIKDFPGKRALPDYPAYTLPLALLADGVKPEDLYPLDIERAFKSLEKIKDSVAVWWQAGAQAPQLLEDNEVQYAAAWSGRVVGNPKLESTYNDGLLQVSYFVVPKGADPATKEAAMGLLHEMSKAENQAIAAEVVPYTGASPDIGSKLPADKVNLYPTSPENRKVQALADPSWTAENAQKLELLWQQFKLGL
ncbi:extracellular solute-binding protein [Pusillimonas sp. ANT_WB101]|uniref:extracellular solute-binding protein n=1 Tax=Pusillimonas sp. ANT_WB101 TaxID=2597356 RepID=UPI0011EEA6C8|nr:extracellular solute-binding protein [Pusillimonas sp. ANT_WB101]KAA0892577.1 extracellular solute-binding protein [Pusillimonas sp. ANT_WB101]